MTALAARVSSSTRSPAHGDLPDLQAGTGVAGNAAAAPARGTHYLLHRGGDLARIIDQGLLLGIVLALTVMFFAFRRSVSAALLPLISALVAIEAGTSIIYIVTHAIAMLNVPNPQMLNITTE